MMANFRFCAINFWSGSGLHSIVSYWLFIVGNVILWKSHVMSHRRHRHLMILVYAFVFFEGLYDEHPDFMDYYERFIGHSAAWDGEDWPPKSPNSCACELEKTTSNWTNQGFRNHRSNQTFSLNEPLRSFREYLLEQVSTFHAGVCSMVGRSGESPALSSGASDFAMLCCIVFDQHAGHLYDEGKNMEHL